MNKEQDIKELAGMVRALFEEQRGKFSPEEFVALAKELGFSVTYPSQASPEKGVEYTYHSEQQPGEGFWAAAPGAGDISEGMVWVAVKR